MSSSSGRSRTFFKETRRTRSITNRDWATSTYNYLTYDHVLGIADKQNDCENIHITPSACGLLPCLTLAMAI